MRRRISATARLAMNILKRTKKVHKKQSLQEMSNKIFGGPSSFASFTEVFQFLMYLKSTEPKISHALTYHSMLPPSSADRIPYVAPALSVRLFCPLAFSDFGHHDSPANFYLFILWITGSAEKSLRGRVSRAVTKAREGEMTKELR